MTSRLCPFVRACLQAVQQTHKFQMPLNIMFSVVCKEIVCFNKNSSFPIVVNLYIRNLMDQISIGDITEEAYHNKHRHP